MIFVTGANGFVGKNLIKELKKRQLDYVAGNRSLYGELTAQKNWEDILNGKSCIIHLAARVHVMNEQSSDPLATFRETNVATTVKMAKAAKAVGVKRFIFVSSIKVNGDETHENPFRADDKPNPSDPYGISKMEAEQELLKLHEKGVFEIVIIRPPLVYGPGVKANFEKLFWLVKKDLPIPFGLVENRRSLVSVYNLCDLIIVCITHANASGEIFLASDNTDYSLKDMINLIGKTLGKFPHLLPIPVSLMKFTAALLGKREYANRLFCDLRLDISKNQKLLNWNPKVSFEDTFREVR